MLVSPTVGAPPAPALEERRVEARPLSLGVLGSYGGSEGRPIVLPGLVPALESGMRHDTRVRPGVSEECSVSTPSPEEGLRLLRRCYCIKNILLSM